MTKPIEWRRAVALAREDRLTYGEIAHEINWPKARSISSLVAYCEAHLDGPRRIRGIEPMGAPMARTGRRAVAW